VEAGGQPLGEQRDYRAGRDCDGGWGAVVIRRNESTERMNFDKKTIALCQLFCDKTDDLLALVGESPSNKRCSAIAAVLYQLFLDESPLVNHILRITREKLEFVVSDNSNFDEYLAQEYLEFYMISDKIDPLRAAYRNDVVLNRDQFLKYKLIFYQGRTFSVKDLIDFGAHAKGGRHHVAKKGNILFEEFDDRYSIGGMGAATYTLRSVGAVAYRAIAPSKMRMHRFVAKLAAKDCGDGHIFKDENSRYVIGQLEKAIGCIPDLKNMYPKIHEEIEKEISDFLSRYQI
jgi:hypothetical protein